MSVILHAAYDLSVSALLLWAEVDQLTKGSGRQPKLPPHPFSETTQGLQHILAACLPEARPVPSIRTIWLPTQGKAPQPSPELISRGFVTADPKMERTLGQWRIETLALPINDAIDFLLALPDQRGFVPGSDLQFWRTTALYALSLTASQQVIPALERTDQTLRAQWRANHTEQRLALLDLMPSICRAMTDNIETAPRPDDLFTQFVDAVVDATMRQAAKPIKVRETTALGGKWLRALTGDDPILNVKSMEADVLYKEWKTWIEQTAVAGNAAFRVAFRLNSPDDPRGSWTLDYLLQATDDPSLIVEAKQIWQGQAAAYLRERFDNPQERLLTGLGFAARLFPPVESSLRKATPQQATLSTTQAHEFLSEIAPLLQASGFHVLLPRWWGGKTSAFTARTKMKSPKTVGKSMLSLDTLVAYDWELMLGGAPISREEFEALATLKQPLVMIRGQWVALDQKQIDAALKFFEQNTGNLSLQDAIQLGLSEGQAEINGIPVEKSTATGWLKSLLESLRQPDKIDILPPPEALHGELRPYQQRGYSWMAFMRQFGLGACLADDMGLGKTYQTIALLVHNRDKLKVKTPALLVCPTSVVGNWRRELLKFAPDVSVMVHQGAQRSTGETFESEAKRHQVVITSYPLLARDRETLATIDWSTAVLDEAQNIKNSSTKQSQAARALNAESRVALTGTPVENRLSELWSIFNFLNPGYLGSEASFRKNFAGPIERVNDAEAVKQLRTLTGPFILRRLKTDKSIINDLPEKLEMKVYCTLTTEQGTLYEAVVKDIMAQIESADDEGDNMSRRGLVLSMLLKLKQVCNHPAQFLKDSTQLDGRSGKLARLTEMLEEIYSVGDRALVFTQFAEMGEMLRDYLRDTFYDEPLWLHGGTPVKEREAMIQRFQATKGPTVFLLSLKAGGVGLNLTRANHVFHFDRWWNPAVENQATDRAFRIGQTKNVQVHKFICSGTLEEKIDDMIESKKKLADSIVGNDENWLTELSTNDLHDLVTLRTAEVE